MKDHNVLVMDEESTSTLASHSKHHFSKISPAFLRHKSAPPTSSGGGSSKKDQTRTVYNTLLAYHDAICTEGMCTDHCNKVYTCNSDVSIFQLECERPPCPRSRPSTTSTINSDTNSLSRETSQSSVRNTPRYQRSRNSRTRHSQQESISDVEDEVGKVTTLLAGQYTVL